MRLVDHDEGVLINVVSQVSVPSTPLSDIFHAAFEGEVCRACCSEPRKLCHLFRRHHEGAVLASQLLIGYHLCCKVILMQEILPVAVAHSRRADDQHRLTLCVILGDNAACRVGLA